MYYIYYIAILLIFCALLGLYFVYKHTTTGVLEKRLISPIQLGGKEFCKLKKIDGTDIESIYPAEAIEAMKDYERN